MQLALLLILIAAPLLELALLIKVGQMIGFWPTMAMVVGTGILGAWLLRSTGIGVLRRLMDDAETGTPPIEAVLDGSLRLLAGLLLLLPGLLTDAAGLALLVPPVRWLVARWILRGGTYRYVRVDTFSRRRQPGPDRRPPERGPGPVIEGEFKRLDEKPADPARKGDGGNG